uniref:Glycogen synthase kinase 3 beta n=1 Tax=Homo sapiens TaxID=9606 RepID=A0A7I2V2U4_HUMAN
MSGRPRTTSFAESCKPVQQPSAFGSMKVSKSRAPDHEKARSL